MDSNSDVLGHWSNAAPYWEKHRRIIEGMFAPITHNLIEAAGIRLGQTVLDIATGPGEPAVGVAEFIGSQGKVIGIDVVPAMVEAARREASRRGLSNACFEVGSADALPFETNSFDAVVSRFGVMFFPSPLDGIREMLRVLKPQGKLAIAVWHLADQNPFHYVCSDVVSRYVDTPPAEPDAPDAFRFAQRGKLLRVAFQAGVNNASERLLQFSIDASLSPEEFWTLRVEMSDKLRAKMTMLSQAQRAEVRQEVIEAVRRYDSDGQIRFPAKVLVVSGDKDAS